MFKATNAQFEKFEAVDKLVTARVDHKGGQNDNIISGSLVLSHLTTGTAIGFILLSISCWFWIGGELNYAKADALMLATKAIYAKATTDGRHTSLGLRQGRLTE